MLQASVEMFKRALDTQGSDTSVAFIDVRTPEEYRTKHIPGVQNIPLDTLEQHINDLERKKTIYIHCQSGKRSEHAIQELEKLMQGPELINVTGGILAWESAGFPVEA